MIASRIGGNLGNQMWHYAICRSVGEKLGYEWGVEKFPMPGTDTCNGMIQMYFMDIDYGKDITSIKHTYADKKSVHRHLNQDYWFNMFDENVLKIEDNTMIQMITQSEDYFIEKRDEVLKWFSIKKDYSSEYEEKMKTHDIVLDENICVINFRGSHYRYVPNLIPNKEYWENSINEMLKINKFMKFIVVSEDPQYAKLFMPFDIPCYHFDIGMDFYLVNKSKFLIIANSSFSWWASWLNTEANLIIAPKYWCSHNTSDGFWSLGDSYSKQFTYMNREGFLESYETCKKQALNFYLSNNLI